MGYRNQLSRKGFGEGLRSTRKSEGLTMLDVSDRSGLTFAAVSDLERGRHPEILALPLYLSALSLTVAQKAIYYASAEMAWETDARVAEDGGAHDEEGG